MKLRPLCSLTLLSLAGLLAGCADGLVKPDPEVVADLRSRYALGAEPAGGVTPVEWRESRENAAPAGEDASPSASDEAPLVLVGRVGGMPSPFDASVEADFPFRAGQAVFFLVDPATAADFAAHAAEAGVAHAADCPFCAREAAGKTDAVAVVSFAGEADEPAAVDARELFGLAEGDLVVVRGDWSLEGGLLVVQADGLFRRE